MKEWMLPCLTKKYLGVECLGCGIQRSLLLVFKGEFVQAFQLYPAIYPMLLLGIVIGANLIFPIKLAPKIIAVLGILTAVTMIGSYVLKHFI